MKNVVIATKTYPRAKREWEALTTANAGRMKCRGFGMFGWVRLINYYLVGFPPEVESMKLYKIRVEHCAPKDRHESIEAFLAAENDEAVYTWIDKEKEYGGWTEQNDEGDVLDIYDKDYNVIGQESYKDKIIRIKGDINDEDQNCDDSYYGLTFYGWEEIVGEEDETAGRMAVLKDMRQLEVAE